MFLPSLSYCISFQTSAPERPDNARAVHRATPDTDFTLSSSPAVLQPPGPHFLESSNHSDLTSMALQPHRGTFQTFSSTKGSSPCWDVPWDAAGWEDQGLEETPMLRPRHRGERSWLWIERLQHKDSCKHQIPADFPFLACFKAFGVRSQGEDPQGHSKIGLGCIHTHSASPAKGWFGTSQGQQLLLLWPFPKGPKHREETGPPGQQRLVLKELIPPQTPSAPSPQTSLQPCLLQHPACPGMPRGRFLPDTPSWCFPSL